MFNLIIIKVKTNLVLNLIYILKFVKWNIESILYCFIPTLSFIKVGYYVGFIMFEPVDKFVEAAHSLRILMELTKIHWSPNRLQLFSIKLPFHLQS